MSAPRRIAAGLLLLCATRAVAQTGEHEGADFQARRDAYLHMMQDMPPGALERALAFKASMMRGPSFALSTATSTWLPIGPGGFFLADGFFTSLPQTDAGRVDAVTFDPTNTNIIYIATPGGGIWKTTNGGASWAPLTDTQCSLQMGAVAVDPVNPSLVYGGVQSSAATTGCSILRSSDGGSTWLNSGTAGLSGFTGGINKIYIDPSTAGSANTSTMVIADNGGGVVRSTNSGAIVSLVLSSATTQAWDIASLPATPKTLYTGIVDRGVNVARTGLWRSIDDGLTWTQIPPPGNIDITAAGRISLATSPAAPNSIFVLAGGTNSKFLGLFRWDENTQQWTSLAAAGVYNGAARGDFGTQATYDLALAVDPVDPTRMYIAGVRAFRSLDGGATFQPMAQNIHCDWHAITIDPKNRMRLGAGTDGGVFLSLDGGDNWVSRNNNLSIGMYYPGISVHPTDPTILLGGSQDNGSQIANGTVTWSGVSGGDGGYTALNYKNPTVYYTTAQWQPGAYILRRNAFTGKDSLRTAGILSTDRATFIPPMVIDPVTPTTLYFGTNRLYRTVNEGSSWAPISVDLTKGSGAILSIAIAPSNPKYIYVGATDGNIQFSHDSGASFTLGSGGPTAAAVTHIAVDPADSMRAIATFSSTGNSHAYITTNGGAIWTALGTTASLPDAPAFSAAIIPGQPNHMFVGDAIGAFESTDGGASWAATTSGLPNVWVYDLVYNSNTQQLVAATYGRGMFSYALATPATVLRGDINGDTKIDSNDALLVLQAMVGTQLSTPAMPRGDTNCNGKLETADALIILNYAVGKTLAGACVGTIK